MAGVGKAAIRPTLEAYGRHLLKHLQIVMPRILMVTSSGVRFAKDYLPTRCPPLLHVEALTRYLQAETRCGRLRLANPGIHADVFVGALSHCVFSETVFGRRTASHAAYIRTLVDNILLAGTPASTTTVSERNHTKSKPGVHKGGRAPATQQKVL